MQRGVVSSFVQCRFALPHVRSSKEDWLHMQEEETDVKGLQSDCRRANGRFCYCKRHSQKTDGKEAQTVTDSTFRWAAHAEEGGVTICFFAGIDTFRYLLRACAKPIHVPGNTVSHATCANERIGLIAKLMSCVSQ